MKVCSIIVVGGLPRSEWISPRWRKCWLCIGTSASISTCDIFTGSCASKHAIESELHLGENGITGGGSGGTGAQARSASQAPGTAHPYRACCCTSVGAGDNGSARSFGTELRHLARSFALGLRPHGAGTLEAANQFLREHYIAEFDARFRVPAAQHGSAFLPHASRDPDLILSPAVTQAIRRDSSTLITFTCDFLRPIFVILR